MRMDWRVARFFTALKGGVMHTQICVLGVLRMSEIKHNPLLSQIWVPAAFWRHFIHHTKSSFFLTQSISSAALPPTRLVSSVLQTFSRFGSPPFT